MLYTRTKLAFISTALAFLPSAVAFAMSVENLQIIFKPQITQIQEFQLNALQQATNAGLTTEDATALVTPHADTIYQELFKLAKTTYSEEELDEKLRVINLPIGKALTRLDGTGLNLRQAYIKKQGRESRFETIVDQLATQPVLMRELISKYENDVRTPDAERIKDFATALDLQEKNAAAAFAQLSLSMNDVSQQVKYLQFDKSSITRSQRAEARTYVKQSKLQEKLIAALEQAKITYDLVALEALLVDSMALHADKADLAEANAYYKTALAKQIAEKDLEFIRILPKTLKPAIDSLIFSLRHKLEE